MKYNEDKILDEIKSYNEKPDMGIDVDAFNGS